MAGDQCLVNFAVILYDAEKALAYDSFSDCGRQAEVDCKPGFRYSVHSNIDPDTMRLRTVPKLPLNEAATSRVIEMAWEDRTPFEAIQASFGLTEADVIRVMRSSLKPTAFKRWRRRVSGRVTKHGALRSPDVKRAYCPSQYKVR